MAKYNFIYTQEYRKPLRVVLVDIRYVGIYPSVDANDLFYNIEDSGGSLAGAMILTVDNAKQSCVLKFTKTRTAFQQDQHGIDKRIKEFINSGAWKVNFLFYIEPQPPVVVTSNGTPSENIWGALIANQALSNQEKAGVLSNLHAAYGRLAINLSTFSGFNGQFAAYTAAGLQIALNINNMPVVGGNPNALPTDMTAYANSVQGVIDVYIPLIACLENEELNDAYYTGTPADQAAQYITMLETAIPLLHAKGILVADGGLLYAPVAALIYWDLLNSDPVAAAAFLADSVPPSYWARFTDPNAHPDWVELTDAFDTLIDYFTMSDLDFVNFHVYEPANMTTASDSISAPTTAIPYIVNYLRDRTGKQVFTNEIGQKNVNAALVTNVLQLCADNNVSRVIWYSGDSDTGQNAKALTEAGGTLRSNGIAFRNYIDTATQNNV